MGKMGEFDYYIINVRGVYVVVITSFYFSWLPFESNVIRKTKDAGYGYIIVQNTQTQKFAIRKPNNRPLTNTVFDGIIGFHHSIEDYNKMHAIGFIGNRVSKY